MPKKKDYSEGAINAFLSYERNIDIAKALHISEQTVIRYKQDPYFQKLLAERKADFVRLAVTKMQGSLGKVVDEVMKIIDNPETAPQVKLNACQIILTQCNRWTETIDIMERLNNLEQSLQTNYEVVIDNEAVEDKDNS